MWLVVVAVAVDRDDATPTPPSLHRPLLFKNQHRLCLALGQVMDDCFDCRLSVGLVTLVSLDAVGGRQRLRALPMAADLWQTAQCSVCGIELEGEVAEYWCITLQPYVDIGATQRLPPEDCGLASNLSGGILDITIGTFKLDRTSLHKHITYAFDWIKLHLPPRR
jgi:hypothetical protein